MSSSTTPSNTPSTSGLNRPPYFITRKPRPTTSGSVPQPTPLPQNSMSTKGSTVGKSFSKKTQPSSEMQYRMHLLRDSQIEPITAAPKMLAPSLEEGVASQVDNLPQEDPKKKKADFPVGRQPRPGEILDDGPGASHEPECVNPIPFFPNELQSLIRAHPPAPEMVSPSFWYGFAGYFEELSSQQGSMFKLPALPPASEMVSSSSRDDDANKPRTIPAIPIPPAPKLLPSKQRGNGVSSVNKKDVPQTSKPPPPKLSGNGAASVDKGHHPSRNLDENQQDPAALRRFRLLQRYNNLTDATPPSSLPSMFELGLMDHKKELTTKSAFPRKTATRTRKPRPLNHEAQ